MELPNDFADNLHRYPLAFLREKYNEMKAEIAADNSRVDLNVYRVLEEWIGDEPVVCNLLELFNSASDPTDG